MENSLGNGLAERAIRDINTFLSCYPHFKGGWKNALEAAVRYHNRSYNSYLGCSPLFKLTKTSPVLPDLHCPLYETEKSQIEQNLYRQRTKFYFNSRKKALPPEMSIDDYILDLDQKMLDHMMVADAEEDTLNCEIEEAEHYSDTFITLERKVKELIDSDNKSDVKSLGSSNGPLMAKSYKLPKIEIRKFDGELINRLPFWAQFEKIHEDTELHDADKFHYLVQSLQSNTRARELIESYPQTAENYAKAVQALKQSSRLNNLLDFLRREVEGEERRLLARRGFEGSSPKEKLRNKFKQNSNIPTAAGLFSAKEMECLFCEKNHQSKDCITAQSMPFKDKRAKIYEKRCCLKCLKPGHLAKACKRTVQCNICAKGYYVLLCPDLPCNRKEKTHVSEVVQSALANQQCTRDVTLMTLMVNIMGNNGYRRVRALLDPGSQKSFILESTALEVKLKPVANVNIAHSLFGGTQTETKCHKVYKVALCSNLSELDTLREFEFLGQDIICGEIPRTPKEAWLNELKGSRIWLSDLGRDSPKIELLIGSDIYGSLLSGRVKQLENGLTAIETHLGWTICGPSPKKDEQTDYSSLVVISMHSRNMSVDYLWDLETIGIKDPRENLTKLEEYKIVHQHFLNTVHQLEDGRFCVGLPWLGNQEGIPSNRHIAERRLFNTTRKLRVKCIFSEYDRLFQEWLAEGVIEKVSPEDLNRKCHYLPHHPVVKADSNTTKIRPVFDASCKDKGNLSLNDCLASGPNVIQQIPAILLKFKEKAIGVIADIRKAFLQIEVKEEDRDYLRFLWWKNNHQIQVFRHKRVVFGVTCRPYLLGAVILHHLKGVSSEFGALPQKLMECLYIDNCVTSVDTEAELVDLVEKSTEIFAKAKMDLRMWQFGPIHRVKEVYSRLPPSVDIERSEEASVLGMKWNLLEDTLNVTPKFGVIINSLSKRDLLSHTQQIFDPIGFLAPVLLPAKLLIQQAWTVKTDWDEPLPSTIQGNFLKWYITEIEDQRICIKFCLKNGFKGAEIFWMLQTAYRDAVMSRRRVFEWYKRFKESREETADNERSGRPSTSPTPEKVDKVLELMHEDQRITVREVAEEAGISIGSTQSIMKDILGVRRLNAVLVPKDLTFDQKNARKETTSLNLEVTTDNPELLKRVITGEKTWIYGFDSETTQLSSEWRFKNEARPKKARKAPSKVKVMLMVFFDYQGIVHHECQQQGSTITADSYLGVLSD
ncbi:hypothetical protein LAZ67_X001627 [Cordylochernes scorpioides]|uniref:CCHC-type domain-containing protein n=1 Tax=Cordylochernes scorpioides TaxID=51811 RepID=A0ABY6LSL2_9ARAC|nr:hypothetical protein LAZ67_X001627 [Cordylochernes scorpioides]